MSVGIRSKAGVHGLVLLVFTMTIALITLFTSTCGGSPSTALEVEEALRKEFAAEGFTATKLPPYNDTFYNIPTTPLLLKLNDEVVGPALQIYEFKDSGAASLTAERTDSDGYGFTFDVSDDGTSKHRIVEWMYFAPHFYRSDKVIVIYLGDHPVILGILENVIGPQFAGA